MVKLFMWTITLACFTIRRQPSSIRTMATTRISSWVPANASARLRDAHSKGRLISFLTMSPRRDGLDPLPMGKGRVCIEDLVENQMWVKLACTMIWPGVWLSSLLGGSKWPPLQMCLTLWITTQKLVTGIRLRSIVLCEQQLQCSCRLSINLDKIY